MREDVLPARHDRSHFFANWATGWKDTSAEVSSFFTFSKCLSQGRFRISKTNQTFDRIGRIVSEKAPKTRLAKGRRFLSAPENSLAKPSTPNSTESGHFDPFLRRSRLLAAVDASKLRQNILLHSHDPHRNLSRFYGADPFPPKRIPPSSQNRWRPGQSPHRLSPVPVRWRGRRDHSGAHRGSSESNHYSLLQTRRLFGRCRLRQRFGSRLNSAPPHSHNHPIFTTSPVRADSSAARQARTASRLSSGVMTVGRSPLTMPLTKYSSSSRSAPRHSPRWSGQ